MTCEQAQERMAECWLEGAGMSAEVNGHLEGCAACREQAESLGSLWDGLGELPSAEPSRALRANFEQMMEAYRLGAASVKAARPASVPVSMLANLWPRQPLAQMAMAAAALVFGVVGGTIYTSRGHDQERIAALSAEVQQERQLVTLSLLRQSSASERLRGVSYSEGMSLTEANGNARPGGNEVTAALLDTLNHDPSVNVRLAAVDALKQFASLAEVRTGLRQAVANQESPLVQISLIDWAVEARDRAALDNLRRAANLNPAVETRLASALSRVQ